MKISRSLFRLALFGSLMSGVNAYAQTPPSGAKSLSDDASEVVSPVGVPGKVITDRSAQTLGDSPVPLNAAALKLQPIEIPELPVAAPAAPPALQWRAPEPPLPGTKTLGDSKAISDTKGISDGQLVEPMIGQGVPMHMVGYPMGYDEGAAAQPTPDTQSMAGFSSAPCDSAYSGSYASSLGRNSCKDTYYWFDAEALLWFGDNMNSPPLVTTAATGVVPLAGDPGVTNAFGGPDGIDPGLLPGYRMSFGTWLNDCRTVGVGARVYGLFSGGADFSQASTGAASIGRPYIDFNSGLSAVYDLSFSTNGVTHWEGNVAASSNLSMVGVDALGKFLVMGDDSHRVTMLAGYGFNRLDDDLSVRSFRINRLTGDLINDGTTFDTLDSFSTSNTFHGGVLGLESDFRRGRFTVGSLVKVGFGNMSQEVAISGATTTVDGVTQQVTNTAAGVLAQGSNSGVYNRDKFAFMPEMGVKLGYDLRSNVKFTVGYTFLYWSDVAMAGDQINPMVDLLQNSNNPTFTFRETGYWMQGVDLGLTFTY